ncbi:MAG: hypothetical protein DRJ10_11010, partial [Bacteroidetes bacterium]
NTSIGEIIKELFDDEISAMETGNYLILKKNDPREKEESDTNKPKQKIKYQITGYIYNTKTGEKLSNTTIYQIGQTNSVLTGLNGYYSLTVSTKDDNIGLAFSKKEYQDTIIVIEPANRAITIGLNPVNKVPDIIEAKGIETDTSKVELENLPVVKFAVPKKQFSLSENLKFLEKQHFQVSILPNLGTNRLMSGNVENNISLNILGGYSHSVKGFEIGGLLNIVRNDVKWAQIAGLGNITGGQTSGVQIAGLVNNNRKSVTGWQLAGITNIVFDTIKGVQLAGIVNVLKGKMNGVQISGIANYTDQNVDGVQLTGFLNYAQKDVKFAQVAGFTNIGQNVGGAQIAGFSNVSTGKVGGVQISGFANFADTVKSAQLSGFMNISKKEIAGIQISTFLNVAQKVKGVQLAFLNIADTVSGASIGFLSFVRKGYHQGEISANELFYTNFSFKTGTKRFYNILTAGIDPVDTEFWTIGYGIGTEFTSKKHFFFGIDLTANQLNERSKEFENINLLTKMDLNFGWSIFKKSAITFGPSISFMMSQTNTGTENLIKDLPQNPIYTYEDPNYLGQLWIGWRVAVRL